MNGFEKIIVTLILLLLLIGAATCSRAVYIPSARGLEIGEPVKEIGR